MICFNYQIRRWNWCFYKQTKDFAPPLKGFFSANYWEGFRLYFLSSIIFLEDSSKDNLNHGVFNALKTSDRKPEPIQKPNTKENDEFSPIYMLGFFVMLLILRLAGC